MGWGPPPPTQPGPPAPPPPHSQGRQAGGPAGHAAEQVRADHQPQDREGARPRRAGEAAGACRRGDRMSRRQFLSLLGAAFVLPPRLRAAQPAQIRRIGMLIGYAENDPETQARLAAFRQGLDHLGWMEGRNVHIDYRFAPASARSGAAFRPKSWSACGPTSWSAIRTPATAALLHVTAHHPDRVRGRVRSGGQRLRREPRAARPATSPASPISSRP